jgi:hypothetical protein
MPMNDSFDPADPLPRFLTEQPDFGGVHDEGAAASRFFKASILITAVMATGIAVLAIGEPAALLSKVTASLVGNSSPQPGTDPLAPAIQTAANAPALTQSTADAQADAQALPPTANDAPARNEVAAPEPAAKDPAETSAPSSEALFRQFQTWMSDQDAQAKAEPAQPVQDAAAQPAQDAPAQVAQDAPAQAADNVQAPHRLAQKHRHVPAEHNAQAEMRTQSPRKPVRRVQDARAERPPVQPARPPVQPVQDARAQQDPSGPNAQAPGFMSIFGQRN